MIPAWSFKMRVEPDRVVHVQLLPGTGFPLPSLLRQESVIRTAHRKRKVSASAGRQQKESGCRSHGPGLARGCFKEAAAAQLKLRAPFGVLDRNGLHGAHPHQFMSGARTPVVARERELIAPAVLLIELTAEVCGQWRD